jgi:hypothetical protein
MDTSPIPEPTPNPDIRQPTAKIARRPPRIGNYWALLTLIGFVLGTASGYLVNDWRHASVQPGSPSQEAHNESDMAQMARQVNPQDGYQIRASFGDVGPQLLAAGAMNLDTFVKVYEQAGAPLNEKQMEILTKGSREQILFNQQNSYFLLNFFWALGLTNQNRILTEGPMVTNSQGRVENFASTGGWSIAAKPIKDLYASQMIVPLTPAQQERLEHVAQNVYRPCCNNSTHFPDCNHGMAMLGLLQLMASQDANEDDMFEAAKYVNAYWYPNQTLEVAMFFKTAQNLDFAEADARQVVSKNFSSGSGYQVVKEWLASNGVLQQAPSGGGSCGV